MLMQADERIGEALRVWDRTAREGPAAGERAAAGRTHLSEDELCRLAGPGGVSTGAPESVAHLSRCAHCLAAWADWRRAVSAAEGGPETEAPDTAYGFLKAAAGRTAREPLNLPSACGRFTLHLLPQMDAPEQGMVALEAGERAQASLEGREVAVRDRKGRTIVDGRLHEGRLARRCEDLSLFDLTAWTVIVKSQTEDGH